MITDIITAASKIISPVIDRVFPDKEKAAEVKAQAEIKLLEMQQTGELQRLYLEFQQNQIDNIDRQSARDREAKIDATGKIDYVPKILAILVVLGFFGLLAILIFVDLKNSSSHIVDIMIGVLGGSVASVMQYYFGSSAGSKNKDTIIKSLKK